MDAKDLKSALAYRMKYKAARTVSKTTRHVRSIEIEDNTGRERDDKFESLYNRYPSTDKHATLKKRRKGSHDQLLKDYPIIERAEGGFNERKMDGGWTDECEKSFNSLKQALTSSPILTYPRIDKDFILDTDTSNEGIGNVLSQNIGNEEHVIAYFSKSLCKPERNYCVTRKELLAIVKSIEHFHHYLYGWKFLLWTDHASLRWLLNFKEPEGQIVCWIQRLPEYDFEIQHHKGISHGNALSQRTL
ncbi:Retrovirus-related Pol polyprotein from transposon 297 [Araneus ventricosus]|uniref:Retrovirus-related Pol polyprotein from transposon 297 n=1 Tax=Araneus ventricosus TaxID=182803 RepID=A0A4Y1ZY49_ARAVE|nr:Retrovirus-related Pol polyprotein from transposon 297 [Araneus ventricosus]